MSRPSLDELVELDRQVSGTNRRRLLKLLRAQQPFWSVLGETGLRGFVSARPGSRAIQIGPCAADDVAGPILFRHAFARYAGQTVLIDLPCAHDAAIHLAEQHGLSRQRTLLRMTRGQPVCERIEWLWASFGPEKG